MAKVKREQKKKITPYTKKKPITKSEKIKNASITEDLDKGLDDLTKQLQPKKKKPIQIRNETMQDDDAIEKEQLEYEKTQNDLEAALGLLTQL